MIRDLREKLLVLRGALVDAIDAIDDYGYANDDAIMEENTIDSLQEMVHDEFTSIPYTPMYGPENVFENEDGFSVVTACNPENGDEFDYYVTPYHELVVTTNGIHGNAEFATSQTVDIPVGYAVKKVYHKFENGKLVVVVPKKKNFEFPFTKKRRPTDFNYLHQKRDKKGRFICMR